MEWVSHVTVDNVAPDDPLPLLLDNPRASVLQAGTGADHLWLRVLDVARALEARSYTAPGRPCSRLPTGWGTPRAGSR